MTTAQLYATKLELRFCAVSIDSISRQALKTFKLFRILESKTTQMFITERRNERKHKLERKSVKLEKLNKLK